MNAESAPKAVPGGLAPPSCGVVQFGGVCVDFDRGELGVDGSTVRLRPKTFALLACLASHPGRLLSKDELMQAVWPGVVVTDDSLVQCVSEVRAALGPTRQSWIRTVPRRGYLLDAELSHDSHDPHDPHDPHVAAEVDASGSAPQLAAVDHVPSSRPASRSRRRAIAAGAVALAGLVLGWGAWPRRPVNPEASLSERRSIEVLPFENLSGDAAQQFFVDGITSDVIADLSRLQDTLVIARVPGSRLASDERRGAGARPAPRFIVSGTVWRHAEDLRIQVRLSSAASHAVLFSDTLVYGADRPWNWREDIAPRVAHALDTRLTDVVGGWRPEAPRPREAVDHTMRGYALLRRAVLRPEIEKAGAEFAAALETAPSSASAWAGLSMSYSCIVLMRYAPEPAALLQQAEAAALRALSLDASLANAHYAHGQVLLLRGRIDSALDAFQRALRLNPSMTFAHARVAVILIEMGRANEAVDHARTALRRSPHDAALVSLAHFAAGMALFHMGRDEESYAEMQKMVAADPRVGFAYQWMAAIDALHGRQERAGDHLAQYRRLIAIQTIQGLKRTERSSNAVFLAQRERFYEGLRRAGLPEH